MEKICILGNNPKALWLNGISNAQLINVNNISINREEELTKFIQNWVPKDLDFLIIDCDSIENTELALQIALRVRLLLHTMHKTSLCRILLVSNLSIESFMGYGNRSILLMTDGINLITGNQVTNSIELLSALSPSEYVAGFLQLIKITPQSNEGRHSIANEWGADVLSQVITFGPKSEFIPLRTAYSLYFMYCAVCSLNVDDINRILNDKPKKYMSNNLKIFDEFNYLLIDDEAEKGWGNVLETMLPNATQTVYSDKASSYADLSNEIKDSIKEGKQDIVFLDLRMNGIDEESIINPEHFSGIKILKTIKEVNPGIQVIMLTATNKGWNVKAILDEGANGYYMKESPEYHFNLSYSKQNAEAFVKAIKNCLNDSYLKDIWLKKKEALERLVSYEDLASLYRVIKLNWESAFILLNQHHYKDALLQLLMAIEAYANKYTKEYDVNDEPIAVVYKKHVNFNDIDETDKSFIFDRNGSFYQTHSGIFKKFQNGKEKHIVDISIVEDGSFCGVIHLSLPVKIAAVLNQHLGSLDGIKQVCELNFIRNNRLAHHGTSNEYIECNRPVSKDDCQFIFDLTYKLIMAI